MASRWLLIPIMPPAIFSRCWIHKYSCCSLRDSTRAPTTCSSCSSRLWASTSPCSLSNMWSEITFPTVSPVCFTPSLPKIPSSRPTTAGRRWWHQASPSVSVVLWEPRHLLCSRVRPSGQTWGKSSAWTRKP